MKKIAIVTATRAEYGLLTPLIRKVIEDCELGLDLIVTGSHLAKKQGYTIKDIFKDGFPIAHEIPILERGNAPYDISLAMTNALKGFAGCFRDDRPDIVVILGDRTEMLAVASAAMNENIPIAHIHGGEVTEGAVDDCVRHAITKMSYLHFTATEQYKKRVIQLGESPDRVYNVGTLGAENILNERLFSESDIRKEIGISLEKPYAVVTFHPVTLEENRGVEAQVRELCTAMKQKKDMFFLVTGANTDSGGDQINEILNDCAKRQSNILLVTSLGMKRYLSAVKYASFVMGNSSSGILEAPVLGTPTVNIGDRQKGRLMWKTIIECKPISNEIMEAMEKAEKVPHVSCTMYGSGNTSKQIIDIIKDYLLNNKINLKKQFFDLEDAE